MPPPRRQISERVDDWNEIYQPWPEDHSRDQAARCMACGVPFCHTGCPLGNLIPEWNHLVYTGNWRKALDALHATNNFPEFTGRICPAPCEASCVLAINELPVTIEYIEKEIVEQGFAQGWIMAQPPEERTGFEIAIVGSGPAGLAAAQQLNRAGHMVTVFERSDYVGGLLALGIPEFKLEKRIVQRRVDLLREEGIEFKTGVNVGADISARSLRERFDALLLTGGATLARELPIPGRELDGIHLAMDYLSQQNKILAGEAVAPEQRVSAEGKNVVILGGGDTGADCLGTAHRQGARRVFQFELLPRPPDQRNPDNPWPEWPLVMRTSGAHEEGGIRDYSIMTKRFSGAGGRVERLHAVRLEWNSANESKRPSMEEIPGSEFDMDVDLVLLALGFVSPEPHGMLAELGVDLDPRGNVAVNRDMETSVPGVFAAGDMIRGASLVVWAIAQGRDAASNIDRRLMGSTHLPMSYGAARL